ncbi:hypothetical protein AMTRI_Chr12g234890 [Amborella trichopoda]
MKPLSSLYQALCPLYCELPSLSLAVPMPSETSCHLSTKPFVLLALLFLLSDPHTVLLCCPTYDLSINSNPKSIINSFFLKTKPTFFIQIPNRNVPIKPYFFP